ncbi:MAG TPA: hypothetical protein VEB42_06085 [Chitinophagaceae bacterium]|nr:hypothetical protein [Chitinophagaceae bacterium]
MEQKNRIDKLVEETLESLEGMNRAKANPFLFTRVEARLKQQGKSGWEQLTAYVSKPAFALAMLCMVIFSNAVVMYRQSAKEEVPEQQQVALTEEYNITTTALYDDENPEP